MTTSSAALGRLELGGGALGQSTPPSQPGTIIEYTPYIGSSKWIEERQRFQLRIIDSAVARSQILEVLVANPLNINEGKYSEYQYIRAKERTTRQVVFYGRIEEKIPVFDDTYGQCIRIIAKNQLRELVDRKMNSTYAADARSAIITDILTNYIYAGSLTASIEASGSTETVDREYANSNISPIKAIEELAIEDPWSDSSFAAAWLWDNSAGAYVNNTVECASAGGVAFALLGEASDYYYFGLNNPFWGLDTDLSVLGSYSNINFQYWNGFAWTTFYPDQYYGFNVDKTVAFYAPDDWKTKSLTNGDPHAAAPPDGTARYWIRVSANAVTTEATVNQILPLVGYGYDYFASSDSVFYHFRRGSRPAGGAGYKSLFFTDLFSTAVAAPVSTADWIGEVLSGYNAENSTANINTTTAGKAYLLADPDASPATTAYWLRRTPTQNVPYFSVIVDADYTWGTANSQFMRGSLFITKGTTWDSNNYCYICRQRDSTPTNNLRCYAVVAGNDAMDASAAITDDSVAYRIDRAANVWTFYYSTTQSPGYSWVQLGTFTDTDNSMGNTVSICLFANSPGQADNQSVQVDWDNFYLWDQNGLTVRYQGSNSDWERAIFGDYNFTEYPREIFTRITVEGVDNAGNRVAATATNSDLESSLQIVKEKKVSMRYVQTTADCTKKANALLTLSGGTVKRGDVRIYGWPRYRYGGAYFLNRAGEAVRFIVSNLGLDKNYILMEIVYEEPPGIASLVLLERKRGMLHSPFSLEGRLEDLISRIERAEQIV